MVGSVPAEDLAKMRDSFKSCAVIVLNLEGLAFFQEAFQAVVARLI